jgi:ABC-type iron transport system FetAB ATPase subunit
VLSVRDLRAPGVHAGALDLADGECVAIAGASGAGKSRLLRALADLDPCEGDVHLDGRAWREMSAPAWRRRVSYVAAEPAWWADRVDAHFDDKYALREGLARMLLPGSFEHAELADLSTGERQRLSLLRTLSLEPRVLLLDEPTSALDGDARSAVEAMLTEHLEHGASALLVTHDPAQAKRLTTRSLRVVDGRLETDPAS